MGPIPRLFLNPQCSGAEFADESVKLVERLVLPLYNPPTALARPRSPTASRPPKPDRRRSVARLATRAPQSSRYQSSIPPADGRRPTHGEPIRSLLVSRRGPRQKELALSRLFKFFPETPEKYVRADSLNGG